MKDDTVNFQCAACGTKLLDVVFDICREFERIHFSEPSTLDEVKVDVKATENIANFCSKKCLCEGRSAAMSFEHVPIPTTRPSVGPVEVCAKCCGVVDMSDWHLTYIESDLSNEKQHTLIIDGNDLAVVCKNCAPFRFSVIQKI